MAYVPANLMLAFAPVGGAYPRIFVYDDASVGTADATIVGANWFSDGALKGMRAGDIVDVVARGTVKYKRYQCASTSGYAATVAAPTAIT